MGMIFGFSSQVAEDSKKASSGVIRKVVDIIDFNNKLTEDEIEKIVADLSFIVRKAAHFSAYALLGALIFLLVGEYNLHRKKSFLVSVIVSLLYACSDEFHQTFVKGRSGELRDVVIDTLGAIFGCTVIVLFKLIFVKIKKWRQN